MNHFIEDNPAFGIKTNFKDIHRTMFQKQWSVHKQAIGKGYKDTADIHSDLGPGPSWIIRFTGPT